MNDNGSLVGSAQDHDLVLIGNASRNLLQALEITEETKREIALLSLGDAVAGVNRYAALRDCLKRAGASLEAQNRAAELTIRHRRQVGILLRDAKKNPGSRYDSNDAECSQQETLPSYTELGIHKKFAQRVQDEAYVPTNVFEEVIEKTFEAGDRELTAKEIEKIGRRLRLQDEKGEWQADEDLPGTVRLFKEDAVVFIQSLARESVDLLLTDPPYSTDVDDIAAFARSWLSLGLSRVRPTGRAYVFIGAYPLELHAYLDAFYNPGPDDVRHSMRLDMVLPWVYRNTIGPSTKDTYKLNWQACLYFVGPEAPALNCNSLVEKFSVQDVNAPDGRHGMRLHPWQKPDEIAERFIRHATEPRQLVCDPFAGTGTFLAAAARLGRDAVGCDVNDQMLGFCKQRGMAS